jgi:chromosome segregation ATPase
VSVDLSGIENAVKFLLNTVEALEIDVDKAKKEIKSRSYVIDKTHREGTERDEKIKEMEKKIKDLENKSIDLENKQFEFNTNYESFKINYQIQNRSVSSMKERLMEIDENLEKDAPNLKRLDEFFSSGKGAPNQASFSSDVDYVKKSDFQKL